MTDTITKARCLKCRREIELRTYGEKNWEPDYDPDEDPQIWRHANGYAACPTQFATPGLEIITLCGSTKFKDDFMAEMKRLTLEGFIVIPVGLFGHSGDLPPEQVQIGNEVKDLLDRLHFRKIDLSDRVHVIDPGGYIGESTRNEIAYATKHEKAITYMSKDD